MSVSERLANVVSKEDYRFKSVSLILPLPWAKLALPYHIAKRSLSKLCLEMTKPPLPNPPQPVFCRVDAGV
jgi:hypothetical protein